MAIWEKLRKALARLDDEAFPYLFRQLLPRIAGDRIALIRCCRCAVQVAVLVSALFFGVALGAGSAHPLNLSGLCLNFAGILRIYIGEEWENIIPMYADEDIYPYGPPSHITREMFTDDNPEVAGELSISPEEHSMAGHYYWQRGLLLILVGLIFQFIAAVAA